MGTVQDEKKKEETALEVGTHFHHLLDSVEIMKIEPYADRQASPHSEEGLSPPRGSGRLWRGSDSDQTTNPENSTLCIYRTNEHNCTDCLWLVTNGQV